MKVEWLNDDCTRATITKGWFRKRVATVRRITEEQWRCQAGNHWWRYEPSDRKCEHCSDVETARRAELHRRNIDQDWQPVGELPRAEVQW